MPFVYSPNSNFQVASNETIEADQTETFLEEKTTVFYPRLVRPKKYPSNLNAIGILGANSISDEYTQPIYYQGEDIVFDVLLYFQNQRIDANQFKIYAVVKPTVYLDSITWFGSLGDGVYLKPSNNPVGLYTIVIPKTSPQQDGYCTRTGYCINGRCLTFPVAGDYQLDVYIQEIPNSKQLIRPVTSLIGTQYFDVEYSAFSPLPETVEEGNGDLARARLPQSGPFPWNQYAGSISTSTPTLPIPVPIPPIPPVTTGSLDFSQVANSQYVVLISAWV